jgi:hypothetical protein
MKAFLIGERNLNFFTPDSIFEVSEISPATINRFLQEKPLENRWQLLGFLSSAEPISLPGYVAVTTGSSSDPKDWHAEIQIPGEKSIDRMVVEIKTPGQ